MKIVLRIDDAGRSEPALDALVGQLLGRGFPISLQVVPGWLHAESIDEVRRLADDHGPRIELGQHGWMHTDHAPSHERAYEFGRTRSRGEQLDDVRRGRDRLAAAFPQHNASVFSPPHDRLDQTALDVLGELGYGIVTGGPRTFAEVRIPPGLVPLPCHVDASRWDAGQRRVRDADELCVDIRRQSTPFVGVVLHPLEIPSLVELTRLVRRFVDLRDEGFTFQTFRQTADCQTS